ncbi:ABC transporter ATP-binding protein [Yinghuangia sp. ASG 101]|uniref:dipeptide ABC transporter ATP-binding protein n=1 Tax=Yinghuangia sp. ASG 101 TaxID=2896848 RepID=UPI001E3F8845|nr:ABC transporter ATP-binding protein [Yinghuangia sp. ASG 101]UGQ12683.1 ABC transporter ATP-binding protein [Yinghuangia sp. ASG 101]
MTTARIPEEVASPPDARTPALVSVAGLDVVFPNRRGGVHAVRGVSFAVARGECLAIVGESGSGKSVTARALVGLAGPRARVTARELTFAGQDLMNLGESRWRSLRGRRIGLVLQDALVSLDPLRTIGAEVAEPLRVHRVVPRADTKARVHQLLAQSGVPDPEHRARQYPHQLSGGLRQRALIASALAGGPELVIADEPTTALDVTVQARILTLLGRLRDAGTAILLISHDLAAVARLADRIAVMRDGEIVEQGPAHRVLGAPEHACTKALLAAVPSAHAKGTRLSPGTEPATPRPRVRASRTPPDPSASLLDVRSVGKRFRSPDGTWHEAVRDVSFAVAPGEILGVVGESGSGKTTVARIVLGLTEPDTGTVEFAGRAWGGARERDRRALRPRIQTVQQDPLGSFDPRYTVRRIVGEAVRALPGSPAEEAHRASGRGAALTARRRERAARVAELLGLVGLSADLMARRARELSGGQRQRVAIARALATDPDLIVCDEPVSALDVSVQAQILDLLADIRAESAVALLFISHDLGVIRHISDRVLVMKDGRVVESGEGEAIFTEPRHPYTRALLAAVPRTP